uniref:Uncharacterized protein n=1 Tax=Ditylenchus dipsaci TaxID=166011 RepID=A0A915EG68_9BILA
MRCRRFRPPYFKYAIFFFCGIELVFSALLMAINQKFWDLADKIFPTAYLMFDDTVLKGEPEDFMWGEPQLLQLNDTRRNSNTCGFPPPLGKRWRRGDNLHEKTLIGYILAPILILLVLVMSSILVWQLVTCDSDSQLFSTLFRQCQKEETFLTELEHRLNCILDDDKEVDGNWECDNTIDRSILSRKWLNPLFFGFCLCHAFMLLGFSLLNKDFSANRKPSLAPIHSRRLTAQLDGSICSEALIHHHHHTNSAAVHIHPSTPSI